MKENTPVSEFFSAVRLRRSVYGIGSNKPVSEEEVLEVVRQALLHAPSAFNSQTGRVAVLFGGEHEALWDITEEALRAVTPPARFAATREKLRGFKAGFGTILFFEEQDTVKGLQEQFPLYADNFPLWSLQSSGMLQYVVWTGLSALGLGASLQHYNPLIDDSVMRRWRIPESYRLISEMPFGEKLEEAGDKEYMPLEERLRVFR